MSAVSGIGAVSVPHAKVAANAAPASASSSEAPGPSGEAVTVALSDEAVLRMVGAVRFGTSSNRIEEAATSGMANMPSDALATVNRLTSEGYKAFSAWRGEDSRYQSQLHDLVRSELGVPDGFGMMVSDNVRNAFKAMGEAHGLVAPPLPAEAAGFAPPPQPSPAMASNIGLLSVFDASPGARVPPASFTMLFDGAARDGAGSGPPVKLGSKDARTLAFEGTSSDLRNGIGQLGGFAGGREGSSAYTIRTEDGSRTAAFISSNGMDHAVQKGASNILSTLLKYMTF